MNRYVSWRFLPSGVQNLPHPPILGLWQYLKGTRV